MRCGRLLNQASSARIFVPLQQPQEPQAGEIGQGLHPAEGLRQAGDDDGKAALGTHH